MFKLSKESKLTFFCLLIIPVIWIVVNHFGLIDGWKIKSVDLRLSSNLPGARGEISHIQNNDEFLTLEDNETIPKVPKIIYVNFDSATLGMDDVGERPWDRAFFRDMSMALLDLGKARVLAFDFAFTPKSVSKMVPKVNSFRSDSAMGELVKSYPNNVVLGCVYSGVSTPFVNDTLADPFPPFFMSGYTEQESSENFRFHYPESPTYPMQSFVNNQYLGRSGSFTVPPYKAADNIPRWVPIWFPAGGKAHAYNILGGKASTLALEMPIEHKGKIQALIEKIEFIENNQSILQKSLDESKAELARHIKNRDSVMGSVQRISTGLNELEELDAVVKNFSQTLQSNPGLSAVIKPQLDARIIERNNLVSELINSILTDDTIRPDEDGINKEIKNLKVIIGNLENTLSANPALSTIIEPQIISKQNEVNVLMNKLSEISSTKEESLTEDQIADKITQINERLDQDKKTLSKIVQELESSSRQVEEINLKINSLNKSKSEIRKTVTRLSGKADTELVEFNESLRLVYSRVEGDSGKGQLVDSVPNELPLFRNRDIYTLGVEALLCYYGLDSENVSISDDGSIFSITDKSGMKLVNAPLTEKQWVEVNWFSKWKEESKIGNLLLSAKKAYANKDFKTYKALMPDIFSGILAKLENVTLPGTPAEYPKLLSEIGIEEPEVNIAKKLLSKETDFKDLPNFQDLTRVQEAIAYYFIPYTLKSEFNPMCGMKDVILYGRFYTEVNATITQIRNNIKLMEGPTLMGKIKAALRNEPDNEKLLSKKNELQTAINQNKINLEVQLDEMKRIKEFFSHFENAIVMVGPEEKTFNDLAPTPFDKSATPKVAVHGNLIKTLSSGIYIKRLPINIDHAATLGVGILMAFLAVYQGRGSSWVQAGGITLLLAYLFMGFVTFSNTHVVWPITAPACAGISTSFIGLAVMVVIEQKAKGRLKGMFGSYVSADLVEQMVESGEEPSLGGEETKITAFFSDVQAFSSFSELLSPTGLVDLMNEYLTAMTNILQEEKGTLDKYIGDAIVAMYGAPIPMNDHAYQAVKTSILMQKKQIELREKWKSEGDKWPGIVSKMQTRIGCNTGTATVGNMGALDRFNYTMMGDMVNLAARCESGAKAYGAYIMITEETKLAAQLTRDDIAFRYLDKIVVKGRKQPVAMYEPTGFMSDLSQETQDCLDCFQGGIDKYLKQDWDGALKMFEKAKSLEPNKPGVTPGVVDNPSMILIDRCQTMKDNPPGDEWDGVYVMTTK